jgi:hypothetical protein
MHCERLAVLPSCWPSELRVLEIEPSKVPAHTSIDGLGSEADEITLNVGNVFSQLGYVIGVKRLPPYTPTQR